MRCNNLVPRSLTGAFKKTPVYCQSDKNLYSLCDNNNNFNLLILFQNTARPVFSTTTAQRVVKNATSVPIKIPLVLPPASCAVAERRLTEKAQN
jgi:hypothetical protein